MCVCGGGGHSGAICTPRLRNENKFGTLNKDSAYLRNIPFLHEILPGQQLFRSKINLNKTCTVAKHALLFKNAFLYKLHVSLTYKTYFICNPSFCLCSNQANSFCRDWKRTLYVSTLNSFWLSKWPFSRFLCLSPEAHHGPDPTPPPTDTPTPTPARVTMPVNQMCGV